MAKTPAQTSYFSVSTFLSTNITYKTAIALDIIRKYYEQRKEQGYNIRTLVVQGYGEHISFEEACLGAWMVFDRLYGTDESPYPTNLDFTGSNGIVGWNGEVENPSVDIPMALQMFDELSAPAHSFEDKWTRMQTIEKYFYKTGVEDNEKNRFVSDANVTPNTYEILSVKNNKFYNWILSKLDEISNAIQVQNSDFVMDSKRYIFDVKPTAKMYDSSYTPHPNEIGIINFEDAIVMANKYYMTFLTVFEQVIYQFTKQMFPIKLYATITYLFNAYLKLIVEFVKPYRASFLDIPPTFRFGDDIFESIAVGEQRNFTITKKLIDSVVKRIFDNPQDTQEPYDTPLKKLRETKNKEITKGINNNFNYGVYLDKSSVKFDDVSVKNTHITTELFNVYREGIFGVTVEATTKLNWAFWLQSMCRKHNLDCLDWNYETKTVTNTWNRDVIIVHRKPIEFVGSWYDSSEVLQTSVVGKITPICSNDVRFAVAFRRYKDPNNSFVYNSNVTEPVACGEWWVYKSDTWQTVELPVGDVSINENIDGSNLMTPTELQNMDPPTVSADRVVVGVYLPMGATFTSFEVDLMGRVDVYPSILNFGDHYTLKSLPNIESFEAVE